MINNRYAGFSVIYWAAGGTSQCAVRLEESSKWLKFKSTLWGETKLTSQFIQPCNNNNSLTLNQLRRAKMNQIVFYQIVCPQVYWPKHHLYRGHHRDRGNQVQHSNPPLWSRPTLLICQTTVVIKFNIVNLPIHRWASKVRHGMCQPEVCDKIVCDDFIYPVPVSTFLSRPGELFSILSRWALSQNCRCVCVCIGVVTDTVRFTQNLYDTNGKKWQTMLTCICFRIGAVLLGPEPASYL